MPSAAISSDRSLRREGARFVLVGGLVALVYTGLTAFLGGLLELPFQVALAVGYFVALAVHFTLHRSYTFASGQGYALGLTGQGVRYLALALGQYVLTALAVAVLSGPLGVPEFVVWAAAVAVFAVVSFVLLRTTTFHSRPS